MSLMQAPVGIMILHQQMAQEERDRKRIHAHAVLPHRRQSPLMTTRKIVGRVMISAGMRLAAQHEPNQSAAGRLSAAR